MLNRDISCNKNSVDQDELAGFRSQVIRIYTVSPLLVKTRNLHDVNLYNLRTSIVYMNISTSAW